MAGDFMAVQRCRPTSRHCDASSVGRPPASRLALGQAGELGRRPTTRLRWRNAGGVARIRLPQAPGSAQGVNVTYRTLVLHLDDDAHADDRFDHALRLARSFESHLLGVSCHRPAPAYDVDVADLLRTDALTAELQRARELARTREELFVGRCRALEVPSFEVVSADEEPERALLRHGRSADLVIVGQPDPAEAGHAARAESVAQLVQRSARPTLVLPFAGRYDRLPESAVVAWDDSRQAARAAADALPLLLRARAVQLVRFVKASEVSGPVDSSPLTPVVHWLERHGVKAQARVSVAESDIGSALLSQAAQSAADLIVMGAWGQARWAERLLGGATRTVLQDTTVPTLMAH
jgi:nucleotide-binding universal stress UspA family protein